MTKPTEFNFDNPEESTADPEKILAIENLTKTEIFQKLRDNNIPKGSRGYSMAKRIIFEGRFIDCDIYDVLNGWMQDYLGLKHNLPKEKPVRTEMESQKTN